MFPRFSELPSDLQEYIVHWASDDYSDPDFNAELMLVCKDFLVWAAHNHYRVLSISSSTELGTLLQTSLFRQTAARSVRILLIADVPTSCSSLICEMLCMTSNLISLSLHVEGGFIFPNSLRLPKLRAFMAGDPDSPADVTQLSPGLARQLTHFTYGVGLILKFTDLLRWLRQPLDSLSHVLLLIDEDCADNLDEWQTVFIRIRDEVLPLLPHHMRVFIVNPEYMPDIQDLDENLVSFIRGELDRRVVFAPSNHSKDPAYIQFEDEVGSASVHLYEADEVSIWNLAEDFISKRDAQN
ncbi:hypothetical protein DL96DRAFT_1610110 [Flagelloscypha sp. PMI_526]|nr:hypothetical protein DL96DRAFT_1610110 [Flagelloscypha sp. PMI_526]